MKNHLHLFFLFLLLILAGYPAHSACKPEFNISKKFETRHEVFQGDFNKLLKRPMKITDEVKEFTSQGKTYLKTMGDYHAVYPIEKNKLMAVIANYNGYGGVLPRVVYSRDHCNSPDAMGYHKQEIFVRIKFAGVGVEYKYIVNIYSSNLGDNNVFANKWNLEKSLDGAFADLYGSWYLKEFKKDGRTYTYVRYYVVNIFREYNAVHKFSMRNFAASDMFALFDSIYANAQKK